MVRFAPLCYFRRSAVEPDTQLYAKFLILKLDAYENLAHSSHFTFKTSAIVAYFQKSPVEGNSTQLNHQKSPKTCNS